MSDLQVCATMNVHDLRRAVSHWVLTMFVGSSRIKMLPRTYPFHLDGYNIWYWETLATVTKILDRLKQNRENVVFFWRW